MQVQTINIGYKPSPKQLLYHRTAADIVLYGGAAGGGKSFATVQDALHRCLKHPGTHAYLFRRSYPELKDTLIKEALRSIPRELGKYRSGDHDFILINGSVLHFRHCLREKDMVLYQGIEVDWLYFDELTSFTKKIFDFLRTRLRTRLSTGIKPVVRCTSNPGGVGHGWVKSMFVDSAPYYQMHEMEVYSEVKKEKKIFKIQYIPAFVTDNPYISSDYIFELEMKPDALRRALLKVDWDAFEGQVFIEFTDDKKRYADRRFTHVIDPFDIPDYWPRYRSFDHGYSRPFSVGWWAIDEFGRMYRYREWYGCVKNSRGEVEPNTGVKYSPKVIAKGILEREAEERRKGITVYGVCDPSLSDRSRGPSIMDSMAQEGVYFNQGDNTRLPGKMQLHERFRFRPDGRPMLQVFNTCTDFIRTVPALPYDDVKVEDIDTDAEDHIYDDTRYMAMMFPLTAKKPEERKKKEFNPLED
jgi:hypothetical protein